MEKKSSVRREKIPPAAWEESFGREDNWPSVAHRVLIIADDATGATVTAALLAGRGVVACVRFSLPGRWPEEAEALVLSADTRHLPAEAVRRASASSARWGESEGVSCTAVRIDSTLRGAPGSAVDGVLEVLPDAAALVVPAFPRSGRVAIGGHLIVEGRPLHETEAGRGMAARPMTSHVPTLLQAQTCHRIAHLPREAIGDGADRLGALLRSYVEEGVRVVVADAGSEEDISVLAEAAQRSALRWVPVDPGPFTAAYVGAGSGTRGGAGTARATRPRGCAVLGVVGSASALTRRQLAVLEESGAVLLAAPSASSDKGRALATLRAGGTVVLWDEPGEDPQGCLSRLATAARHLLEEGRGAVCGLYVSGGDSLRALCAAVGAEGLRAIGEVEPLVGLAELVGGPWDGLPVVAKGGLVGTAKTARDAVARLRAWCGGLP